MKIEFSGAARHVTGSKHLLHLNGKKILLDCGLFQGRRKQAAKWNEMFPFEAKDIDVLVLSHAHIDHSGAIPLLVKKGFEGPIYCTHATRDLCAVMLRDSAYIQQRDAEYMRESGKDPLAEPLYGIEDADKAIAQFRSVNYDHKFKVSDGAFVTFRDAGHILGSAVEEWEIHDNDTHQDIRFGFTGDLGRKDLPVLKDPVQLENLDFLLTESTYGDRLHDEIKDVEDKFAASLNEAYERNGKIIIPAFAMGRTQEILYMLKKLVIEKKIKPIPIFVDSPLASAASEVFQIHPECYDEEMQDLIRQGINPFISGEGVQFTSSVDESKALNKFPGSCVIISASGMCEFGRIRHHLANSVQDDKNLVLIVGFQAENTLGRKLVEGDKSVNIFGEPHTVNSQIQIYNAFSGHADQKGLLRFAGDAGPIRDVFLVHGESDQQNALAHKMKDLKNFTKETGIHIPCPGETYELTSEKRFVRTHEMNEISMQFATECEILSEEQ
ncbi:MBL fold metallo-hydrolase [bacterium]|nr:MBL fold metallo-hydrolase [bacterium]NCQ54952.1 MBL fold metallo-hydrolase [Candidatus Parcubacteria bacterium]NCS66996.1 MBL fold metallo-hydrolase [Candidatus Peregrinibacteria bacterium]NCS95942.1 MBL fold metallo-hydrolase [bacterium]